MNLSLVLLMTVMGAFAGLFLKRASGTKGLKDLLVNRSLYFGAGLYLLSALINIYLLRTMDYSVVLPLTSITYIWTMAISYSFLRERIGRGKIVGVALILIGAFLVTR
jgi:drug/metabolite transporter (DMT)-like permease